MKFIILTPCITRGEFHKKSLGKFYELYGKHLVDFEIFHIFNIDSPKNLEQYFTPYETIGILTEILPKFVNRIFTVTETPGFTGAFIGLMNKVKELNLLSADNFYWWLEDDWEIINDYNIFNLIKMFCQVENLSMNFTRGSPLGSFRAGPIMSGSYFLNYFNIVNLNIMRNSCDPEKQVGRWLSGNKNKNIHRDITNNNIIDIFTLYHDKKDINPNDFTYWHYKKTTKYNKDLILKFHILLFINNEIKIANINTRIYDIVLSDLIFKPITINEFKKIFDGDNIKYITIHPYVFNDIGKYFNEDFKLKKWDETTDTTSYKISVIPTIYCGNNDNLTIRDLRLKPNCTLNQDFIDSFYDIIIKLPYLEKHYSNFNINYYSHRYGTYPNFNVFGNVINFIYSNDNDNLNLNLNLNDIAIDEKILDFNLLNKCLIKYFKFNVTVETKQKKNRIAIFNSSDKKVDNYNNYNNNDLDFIYSESYKIRQNYYDDITTIIGSTVNNVDNLNNLNNEYRANFELTIKNYCKKNQEHLKDIITNLIIMSKCDTIISDNIKFINLIKIFNPNIIIKY